MAFTCNIDRRGRLTRFIMGVLQEIAAACVLLFLALPHHSTLGWIIGIVLIIGGAFTIFEARMSWCAFRAMGFKTRF